MAEFLQRPIKKTMFEFPSGIQEGPTEFSFEKNISVNDFLSFIADRIMGLIFFPKKLNDYSLR